MIYAYRCSAGHEQELQRSVADRNNPVKCFCGEPMERNLMGELVTAKVFGPPRAECPQNTCLPPYFLGADSYDKAGHPQFSNLYKQREAGKRFGLDFE